MGQLLQFIQNKEYERKSGPGPQRIIKGGNGEIYFTPDHYHFFIKIR